MKKNYTVNLTNGLVRKTAEPVNLDTGVTGWFGRASKKGQKGCHTKVHYTRDGKPVCGHKPHKTMQFQFCAHGFQYTWVECKGCRDWLANQRKKE